MGFRRHRQQGFSRHGDETGEQRVLDHILDLTVSYYAADQYLKSKHGCFQAGSNSEGLLSARALALPNRQVDFGAS
jgi:hypothetical protein